MFDLVDYLCLLCCWCCGRKDKDVEEYEISERDRARQQLKADLSEGAVTETQPKKPPQLAHAPQIQPEDQRYYAGVPSERLMPEQQQRGSSEYCSTPSGTSMTALLVQMWIAFLIISLSSPSKQPAFTLNIFATISSPSDTATLTCTNRLPHFVQKYPSVLPVEFGRLCTAMAAGSEANFLMSKYGKMAVMP
ncbi:hypothetical protein H2200_000066 [Cladophialophora chaetospira]|uniref:Uncharacterized protein n=1 Tax=Cladophialophora chaetospira TaxID=386627 RepID=A0AA38XMQ2_9EURO|nr:hypothetical protein H2200_000066 [Cladophialophora chaetospira]